MKFKFLLCFSLVLILCGCNENSPEISQIFWQFNVYHNPETRKDEQILSLYVLADDKDGISDIETMYLINDDSELFWKISGSDLKFERYGDSEVWIGNSCIKMSGCFNRPGCSDDVHIPDGKCRVLLLDAAGKRDEVKVMLKNNIAAMDYQWPVLTVDGNSVKIAGSADFIWAFDENMKFTGEYEAKATQTLKLPAAACLYLYKNLPQKGYGLIIGPFKK